MFYFEGNEAEAWAGVSLAHAAHLFSVLVMYQLALVVFGKHLRRESIAFISSCLHIISPAGLFLSAPYGESPLSFLQFSGFYCYALHRLSDRPPNGFAKNMYLILSGGLFGLATLIRSNGILSGLIFAYDALYECSQIPRLGLGTARLQRLACIVVAGLFVAVGAVLPQSIAYMEYCGGTLPEGSHATWCNHFPPSIYPYVQSHYWYVKLALLGGCGLIDLGTWAFCATGHLIASRFSLWPLRCSPSSSDRPGGLGKWLHCQVASRASKQRVTLTRGMAPSRTPRSCYESPLLKQSWVFWR